MMTASNSLINYDRVAKATRQPICRVVVESVEDEETRHYQEVYMAVKKQVGISAESLRRARKLFYGQGLLGSSSSFYLENRETFEMQENLLALAFYFCICWWYVKVVTDDELLRLFDDI